MWRVGGARGQGEAWEAMWQVEDERGDMQEVM